MTALEIITRERSLETYEQLTPMLRDEDLQDIVAAWPQVFEPWTKEDDEKEAESWEQIWAERIDVGRIAEAVGMHPKKCACAIRKAITYRLIYPNGMIHGRASSFLAGLLAKAIALYPVSRGRSGSR